MAIKHQVLSSNLGINIPDAYIRLEYINWSTSNYKGTAVFNVWADRDAKDAEKDSLGTLEVDITNLFTPEIMAQAYAALKIKPEFTGAEDLFEDDDRKEKVLAKLAKDKEIPKPTIDINVPG